MSKAKLKTGFHNALAGQNINLPALQSNQNLEFEYTFENHFHPYVGELIEQLNKKSLDGLLNVNFHASLVEDFFEALYNPNQSDTVTVNFSPKEIDVSENGGYALFDWELLFHVPLTIAVHLSKNQRFGEAQRWFHYIFDPTDNSTDVPAPTKFWKFLRFRQETEFKQIDQLLQLLSKPTNELEADEVALQEFILSGYEAIRKNPFQPHKVAQTRHTAYQYYVVMKYLDNVIAWGDALFREDSIESINEATLLYVLAANILGPKPQRLPQRGKIKPKSFAQLRASGLDPMGNALVSLEGQFPFNLYTPGIEGVDTNQSNALFGLGETLYFCPPQNDKLLSCWDTVADRLFKIRHCMNIEGVVRPLPLFQPSIDLEVLVKGATGGIDISSLVNGFNQPLSPVRAPILIQKAMEICSELRGLGANLLSALEKKDAEALSRLRQQHEINIQKRAQDVRFIQWKEAEESTEALLKTRKLALERYFHYMIMLGSIFLILTDESSDIFKEIIIERQELSEKNFDEVYKFLIGQYAEDFQLEAYPPNIQPADLNDLIDNIGPRSLSPYEHIDLNQHMPSSQYYQQQATNKDKLFGWLSLIPDFSMSLQPFGLGGTMSIGGGSTLGKIGRIRADKDRAKANELAFRGGRAQKAGSYERREYEWILNRNLAALELMQIGRQLIASLIREQITRQEYENQVKQIEQSEKIKAFFEEKFTNEQLYGWMQGELSKLYYEYYKFAFDIARQAERMMKHELMRPELDEIDFIKFNYWDGGRKGFFSGEAMYLDLKRMEMAYYDHNKREYEITTSISIRQLDPVALLKLKATGSCEVTLPETLFDIDCPGHYMRRIKNVSLSIPSVVGPFTSVNCTLSLIKSSLRKSPLLSDDIYAREGSEDPRFKDNYGTIESIVSSNANNDSGLFETNLRDERPLPFEGAGAISTWKLTLPAKFRQFNYNTIFDVILHMRYTARQGGAQLGEKAVEHIQELIEEANSSGLGQLFSLHHNFSTEWHQFLTGDDDFTAIIKKEYFPYFIQDKNITIDQVELYAVQEGELLQVIPDGIVTDELTTALEDNNEFEISLAPDDTVLVRDNTAHVFILFRYSVS